MSLIRSCSYSSLEMKPFSTSDFASSKRFLSRSRLILAVSIASSLDCRDVTRSPSSHALMPRFAISISRSAFSRSLAIVERRIASVCSAAMTELSAVLTLSSPSLIRSMISSSARRRSTSPFLTDWPSETISVMRARPSRRFLISTLPSVASSPEAGTTMSNPPRSTTWSSATSTTGAAVSSPPPSQANPARPSPPTTRMPTTAPTAFPGRRTEFRVADRCRRVACMEGPRGMRDGSTRPSRGSEPANSRAYHAKRAIFMFDPDPNSDSEVAFRIWSGNIGTLARFPSNRFRNHVGRSDHRSDIGLPASGFGARIHSLGWRIRP